jgi:hypothetical protein
MKNLIKRKIFIGTFLLTYFLFFIVTVFILDLKRDGVGIGHIEYGFPFVYYYSHCFGGYYLWDGLIGNVLFATVLGLIIGLVMTHFGVKFSSPEFRSKWYLNF